MNVFYLQIARLPQAVCSYPQVQKALNFLIHGVFLYSVIVLIWSLCGHLYDNVHKITRCAHWNADRIISCDNSSSSGDFFLILEIYQLCKITLSWSLMILNEMALTSNERCLRWVSCFIISESRPLSFLCNVAEHNAVILLRTNHIYTEILSIM